MPDTLRDRIAAVQKAHIFCLVECSCGYQIDSIHPSSPDWKIDAECDWADHVADAVIESLGLHMQYENSRVMYDEKPAACKENGLWKQRIVSPHEPYKE